jgi:hypothetical protein
MAILVCSTLAIVISLIISFQLFISAIDCTKCGNDPEKHKNKRTIRIGGEIFIEIVAYDETNDNTEAHLNAKRTVIEKIFSDVFPAV